MLWFSFVLLGRQLFFFLRGSTDHPPKDPPIKYSDYRNDAEWIFQRTKVLIFDIF